MMFAVTGLGGKLDLATVAGVVCGSSRGPSARGS